MPHPCLASCLSVVLLTQSPGSLPLREAEAQYLEEWDRDPEGMSVPPVSRRDRPAMQWLAAAARQDLPANPFPRGGGDWREAEAVRRLLRAAPDQWARTLRQIPLTLSGSRLALWRWGQQRVRDGRIDKALRLQWEDFLLNGQGPDLIRETVLRHALCFALDEADDARFSALKRDQEDAFPGLFPQFQSAFALLGSPAPTVRLWSLPDMRPLDISLAALGTSPQDGLRIRIAAAPEQGLPDLPKDVVWVAPTREGSQPPGLDSLEGESLAEAVDLASRLKSAGRIAYLAPVRESFEAYALMYFPILLELDPGGTVRRIRMGDAALARRP